MADAWRLLECRSTTYEVVVLLEMALPIVSSLVADERKSTPYNVNPDLQTVKGSEHARADIHWIFEKLNRLDSPQGGLVAFC